MAAKRKASSRRPASSPAPSPTATRESSRAPTEEYDPFEPDNFQPQKRLKTALEDFNVRYDVENKTNEEILGMYFVFVTLFLFLPSPSLLLCGFSA
jgi:hypothetical protein